MHKVRPIRSLFHPAIFVSILGQAAIHLYCMVRAVSMSTDAMGPELLKEVKDFHKKHKNWGDGDGADAQKEDEDPMAMFKSLWSTPFMPNLLNTVVFLVETSQMVAVLFVNYKGRPWMKGLLENHALFLSVFLCAAGVAVCAWAVNPQLNGLIHLAEFPDDDFRLEVARLARRRRRRLSLGPLARALLALSLGDAEAESELLFRPPPKLPAFPRGLKVMRLVAYSLAGSFAWDRLVTALFAPRIFSAMLDSARETTLADLAPLATTIGKVLGGVFLLAQGNLLVLGGVYWMYSQHKKAQAAQEDA